MAEKTEVEQEDAADKALEKARYQYLHSESDSDAQLLILLAIAEQLALLNHLIGTLASDVGYYVTNKV